MAVTIKLPRLEDHIAGPRVPIQLGLQLVGNELDLVGILAHRHRFPGDLGVSKALDASSQALLGSRAVEFILAGLFGSHA